MFNLKNNIKMIVAQKVKQMTYIYIGETKSNLHRKMLVELPPNCNYSNYFRLMSLIRKDYKIKISKLWLFGNRWKHNYTKFQHNLDTKEQFWYSG